jgi:tetratricopeptide (TPR) repeat protein
MMKDTRPRIMTACAAAFAFAGVAVMVFPAKAQTDWWEYQCENKYRNIPADLRINRCTALIQAVGLSKERRAAALNYRGNAFVNLERDDRALEDYSAALALNPGNAFALFNRCALYERTDRPELALPDCDEAIRLDPKLAVAYDKRGDLYNRKRDYDKA